MTETEREELLAATAWLYVKRQIRSKTFKNQERYVHVLELSLCLVKVYIPKVVMPCGYRYRYKQTDRHVDL